MEKKEIKLTKAQFIIKAREMFDGQFPNEITMRVPRFDWMDTQEKSIKEELWDWFRISIEKYDELVDSPPKKEKGE